MPLIALEGGGVLTRGGKSGLVIVGRPVPVVAERVVKPGPPVPAATERLVKPGPPLLVVREELVKP